MPRILHAVLACAFFPLVCLGWSGHDVTEGNVRVAIDEIADVSDPFAPVTATVRVRNAGEAPIKGHVEIRELVDDWRVVGDAAAGFEVAPGKEHASSFSIVSGSFVFAELYPVHAYVTLTEPDGTEPIHAVRIFRVASVPRPASPKEFTAIGVPPEGAIPLLSTRVHRAAWQPYDGDTIVLGVGWSGQDQRSRTLVSFGTMTRGDTRQTLGMHPPWGGERGTAFCDYLVTLPKTTPIALTFANAIRDHHGTEPPSDGVLFRVWAGAAQDGSDAEAVFADFTDSKTWRAGKADLTPYAGRTILLRLESHPGPKRNTVCDSSYWAEPTVVAGHARKGVTGEELAASRGAIEDKAQRLARGGGGDFKLAGGAAAVVPGQRGLLDGIVAIATADRVVSFDGFEVDIDGHPVSCRPSPAAFKKVEVRSTALGMRYAHYLDCMGEPVKLTIDLYREGAALKASVSSSGRITRFAVGPWSRKASRVYYGHGYCIEDPEPFRSHFGGHNLASSHVGCDFEGGISVLQASDAPPTAFAVDPNERVYALETRASSTITLVPGRSAFDCAIAYRPHYDKKAAPAVGRLAGRFCFDIWGGGYGDIADRMQRMIEYGLTDSFITIHNWQRWGYDYRLPDIYPPNPKFGTLEEMKRIGAVCRAQDVPWGLHDNYIDFYPDAEDYSYRNIYFTRGGRPHRAWYNPGRDALSYKWRPDKIMRFVKRNYGPIEKELNPSHCFIDVFTSVGCVDWWDCDGGFHSGLETRRHWGEAFVYIRNLFGGNAPQTSEAGHDQLIGYLDGADCQWLTLSPEGRRHMIRLRCGDWERVPWYDAVNHHRFILHGVGYSSRYQGERPREAHGINSDDYISAEVLSGHALMVDAGSWGRLAVRKYYLAQDVARALALGRIADVTFVDGDIHRQRVTWEGGVVAHVNRGVSDWRVCGRVLPPYGFLVEYGDGYACCVEKDAAGNYRESSIGPSGWYCNARSVSMGSRHYRIRPHVEGFEQVGDRTFEWTMVWDAREPAPSDQWVYVHFCKRGHYGYYRIRFQDDHRPKVPTSKWQGEIRIRRRVTVPGDIDGEVQCAVGLHDRGRRLRLSGTLDSESRVVVGKLQVGKGEGRVPIRFLPPPSGEPLPPRNWNPSKPVLDFGFARTDGAFRVRRREAELVVTPLPDSPAFAVVLDVARLAGKRGARVSAVRACELGGDALGPSIDFKTADGWLTFRHDGKSACYRIAVR